MKSPCKKSVLIVFLTVFFVGIFSLQAQNSVPEWATQLPGKKGFVFGVGVGKSTDLAMAKDKARMAALSDLTKNYTGKFETFAIKCDTVLGPENAIRQIVTTFKLNQNATFTGVEIAETQVVNNEGGSLVYMLLKLDIRNDIKTLQQEVDEDSALRKKLSDADLLKELKGL